MTYIIVLMLVAFDFWISKNIIGRKLVKLRWWYTVDDASGGVEKWMFESRAGKYIDNINSYLLFRSKNTCIR
jgi:hypothetical protein